MNFFENLSLYDTSSCKNVISDDALDLLEDIIYNSDLSYNNTCPISFIDFNDGDIITKLTCGHIFNKKAIYKWLTEEKAECPVCRYKFKSKEIDICNNIIFQNNQNQDLSNITRFFPFDNFFNENRLIHPFGPIKQFAIVVNEDDDINDIFLTLNKINNL